MNPHINVLQDQLPNIAIDQQFPFLWTSNQLLQHLLLKKDIAWDNTNKQLSPALENSLKNNKQIKIDYDQSLDMKPDKVTLPAIKNQYQTIVVTAANIQKQLTQSRAALDTIVQNINNKKVLEILDIILNNSMKSLATFREDDIAFVGNDIRALSSIYNRTAVNQRYERGADSKQFMRQFLNSMFYRQGDVIRIEEVSQIYLLAAAKIKDIHTLGSRATLEGLEAGRRLGVSQLENIDAIVEIIKIYNQEKIGLSIQIQIIDIISNDKAPHQCDLIRDSIGKQLGKPQIFETSNAKSMGAFFEQVVQQQYQVLLVLYINQIMAQLAPKILTYLTSKMITA